MEIKTTFSEVEAAERLGINQSTLSLIEKLGLLSPAGISNGQKYFSIESITKYLETSDIDETSVSLTTSKKPSYSDNENIEDIIATLTKMHDAKPNSEPIDKENSKKEPITIYNFDFLKTIPIQESSVDLIVTSPPYNVDIKYNSHNDTMTYDDYLLFTKEWLTKSYSLLKNEGRLCLNVPLDKNKGGQQSMCADITVIAKQVGFKYHSTVIWNEQNISRRTAWGSWLSASAPYVIAPVEVIIILYKESWKKTGGSRKSDITKSEFLEWTNGVWNFSGESKKRIGHPAPFPVELPYRCIKLFSFVGDVVLDPFLGSGSTLIASLRTGRVGLGVDVDAAYCELAQKRLNAEERVDQLAFDVGDGQDYEARKKHKRTHNGVLQSPPEPGP